MGSQKKYTAVFPEELYKELELVAEAKDSYVVNVLRSFVGLGLFLYQFEKSGGEIVIKIDGEEYSLSFFKSFPEIWDVLDEH